MFSLVGPVDVEKTGITLVIWVLSGYSLFLINFLVEWNTFFGWCVIVINGYKLDAFRAILDMFYYELIV